VIRAAIVDDEPLARRRLRQLLEEEDDIALVAEFEDGAEAVGTLEGDPVDLLFLDIRMPETDGFEVAEALLDRVTVVVFVTAHDDQALRAFDVRATDYLVKPFTRERFRETLDRARRTVDDRRDRTAFRAELRALAGRDGGTDRLPVPRDGRIRLVRPERIEWVEADGNYVVVHADGERHRLRSTLGNLHERLPSDRFLRIHRSTLVNVDRIRELEPWSHGDYLVVLESGDRIVASRTYSPALLERLEL